MNTILASRQMFSLGVGFRYSPYGQMYNPGPKYWLRVGQEIVKRFPGARPEVVWIVSVVEGAGSHLTFPGNRDILGISFSQEEENNETLELFDQSGFRVWLQVEPADIEVESLSDLILKRYENHACLVGVGVDAEWHHSSSVPEGQPVSDSDAANWLNSIRKHGSNYGLFVKHWKTEMLPATLREGVLFVDDSQMFESIDHMLDEFAGWGKHFYPAPVAFQIGYPADKKWWAGYDDPIKEIGEGILQKVPNTSGLFWVNFSVFDVFPP